MAISGLLAVIKGDPLSGAGLGHQRLAALLLAGGKAAVHPLLEKALIHGALHAAGRFPKPGLRQLGGRLGLGQLGRGLFQLAALPRLLQVQQHGVAGPAVGAVQGGLSVLGLLLLGGLLPGAVPGLAACKAAFLQRALRRAAPGLAVFRKLFPGQVLPQHADSLFPRHGILLRQALGLAAAGLDGVIVLLQQLAVLLRGEGQKQLHPLLAQGLWGPLLNPALLDAHIHHVAHQVGQA